MTYFGKTPSVPDFRTFLLQQKTHFLDGHVVELDGLKIGGLSGVVGDRARKLFRRAEKVFAFEIKRLLGAPLDLLVMHAGQMPKDEKVSGSTPDGCATFVFDPEFSLALPDSSLPIELRGVSSTQRNSDENEEGKMIKALLAAILIGIANNHAQTVHIRNKPVDLSPVVKWLEKKEGERPMPHWKVIEIESILAKEWGGYRVSAKVDGGNYKAPIVLQNIPEELLKLIAIDDATLKALAEIESKVAVLERQNLELQRQKELTVREYSTAYELAVGQIQANEVAMAGLRTAYLNQQQTLNFTSEAKKSKLLAYFTGQKVGPHEVWDCGTGAKILKIEGLP